jgi:septum formation protein
MSLQSSQAPAIVLASSSRVRASLLDSAGLAFTVDKASVDEGSVRDSLKAEGAPAEHAAELLAEMKAISVSGRHPGSLVIGADQMLDQDGRWYEKPGSREQAAAQLRSLAGRRHRLISSVVVAENGVRIWHHVDEATLTMRPLGDEFLERYLDTVGPRVGDTVGGYELEGLGVHLFSAVAGDFFTILGLPLLPLLGYLRQRGVLVA